MSTLNEATSISKGSSVAKVVNLGTTPVWPKGDDAYIIKVHAEAYAGDQANEIRLNIGYSEDTMYDVVVDWGDGTTNEYKYNTLYNSNPRKRYTLAGEYIIKVKGHFSKFNIVGLGKFFCDSVTEVLSWGSKDIGIIDANNGFLNCTVLNSIVSDYRGFFTNTLYADSLFKASKIQIIPDGLFDKAVNLESVDATFEDCTLLKSYQSDLFYTNKKIKNFYRTFMNCTELSSRTPIGPDGVELWQRNSSNGYVTIGNSYLCYHNCLKVPNYSSIPNNWINT